MDEVLEALLEEHAIICAVMAQLLEEELTSPDSRRALVSFCDGLATHLAHEEQAIYGRIHAGEFGAEARACLEALPESLETLSSSVATLRSALLSGAEVRASFGTLAGLVQYRLALEEATLFPLLRVR